MLGSLIMNSSEQLTAEMILRAARGGETLAQRVVSEHCRWLGRALANLISSFNPESVVLGGELGLALNPYLQEIRDEAQRWACSSSAKAARIALAKLTGETALLVGAARLAWQKDKYI